MDIREGFFDDHDDGSRCSEPPAARHRKFGGLDRHGHRQSNTCYLIAIAAKRHGRNTRLSGNMLPPRLNECAPSLLTAFRIRSSMTGSRSEGSVPTTRILPRDPGCRFPPCARRASPSEPASCRCAGYPAGAGNPSMTGAAHDVGHKRLKAYRSSLVSRGDAMPAMLAGPFQQRFSAGSRLQFDRPWTTRWAPVDRPPTDERRLQASGLPMKS